MKLPHRGRTSAGLVAVALVLTACGSKTPSPAPASSPSVAPSTSAAPVPTSVEGVVHYGTVAGKIPPKYRTYVLRSLAAPVNQWLDAAYIHGPFPATRYPNAFASFTPRAAKQAGHAREMTLGKLGKRITGVVVKKRKITIDVVTARLKPIGATARFRLWLVTEGGRKSGVAVRGSVYLMPDRGGWRIFGYDVKRVSK